MLPSHVISFSGTAEAVTVGKTVATKRLNGITSANVEICFALISLSLLTTIKGIHGRQGYTTEPLDVSHFSSKRMWV